MSRYDVLYTVRYVRRLICQMLNNHRSGSLAWGLGYYIRLRQNAEVRVGEIRYRDFFRTGVMSFESHSTDPKNLPHNLH